MLTDGEPTIQEDAECFFTRQFLIQGLLLTSCSPIFHSQPQPFLPLTQNTTQRPQITICALTFGDYTATIYRCLESIRENCDRRKYRLFVGCNAGSPSTVEYLEHLYTEGHVDRLFLSNTNLNKCPIMRRMFAEVKTDFIWWLDDDSHLLSPDALLELLEIATSKCFFLFTTTL